MVWSDKTGLLTWSRGRLILVRERSSLYVGDRLRTWAVVFVRLRLSCTWAVVCIRGQVDVVMGVNVDVLRSSRVVVVVVVMGCSHRVTVVDALWTPWTWLWLWLGVVSSSSSVDRPWVARGRVIVLVC